MCLVAVEDELSAAVVRRILAPHSGTVGQLKIVGLGGNTRLKSGLKSYLEVARNVMPVFMLTDLDQGPCAPALVAEWLMAVEIPARFLFRVAVREVEAWLLADREAAAAFLGIATAKITREPESILRAKTYLLSLASRSPRELRMDLLPAKGAVASQGFRYNDRMCRFVEGEWSPERAGETSASLKRTLARIVEWTSRLEC